MIIMTLISCNQPTVTKTDLPIEIVSLKEAKKFDTTLTISSNTNVYVFSKQEDYIGAYNKINDTPFFSVMLLIVLMFLVLLLILV